MIGTKEVTFFSKNEIMKTVGNVNYYLKDSYYIVGDNSTEGSGITSTSITGEIEIIEKIEGIEVKEIGCYAFRQSKISRVIIRARLKSINRAAFYCCKYLTYINIPSTVTFIGMNAINSGESQKYELAGIVEFEEGRKEKLYLKTRAISRRQLYYIIYPSSIAPTCESDAMQYVETAHVCAPTVFSFCQFQTTTNSSECPSSSYPRKGIKKGNIKKRAKMLINTAIFLTIRTENNTQNENKSTDNSSKDKGFIKKMMDFFRRNIK